MTARSKSNVLVLDTKGSCLLCFNPTGSSNEEVDNQNREQAFKMIMSYLQVNVLNLCSFSKHMLQSVGSDGLNDFNVKVQLCDDCSSVGSQFQPLFTQFESIKQELDKCCVELHKLIAAGTSKSSNVREYEKRMETMNPVDLFHANVAENIRKETRQKCWEKLDQSLPKGVKRPPEEDELCNKRLITSIFKTDPVPINSTEVRTKKEFFVPMVTSSTSLASTSTTPTPSTSAYHQDYSSHPIAVPTSNSCPYCERTFSNKLNCERHMILTHGNVIFSEHLPPDVNPIKVVRLIENFCNEFIPVDNSSSVQCPHCGSTFTQKPALKTHIIRNHHSELIWTLEHEQFENTSGQTTEGLEEEEDQTVFSLESIFVQHATASAEGIHLVEQVQEDETENVEDNSNDDEADEVNVKPFKVVVIHTDK